MIRRHTKELPACFLALFTGLVACSVDPLESSQTEYYVPEDFEFDESNAAGEKSGQNQVIGVEEIEFKFLNKADKTVKLGEKVEISILAGVADPTATWSLFYTTDSASLANTTAILKGQPTSQTTTKWDTTFVGPGSYQLAALVETQGKFFLFRSSSKITIEGAFIPQADAAKIGITSPITKEIYNSGAPVNVQFEVLDDPKKYVSYDVEFTLDGTNFQPLQAGAQPSTPIAWTLPDSLTDKAKIRVLAKFVSGASGTIEQEAAFGISNQGEIDITKIKAIVDANCISCHGSNNPSGGLRLDSNQRIANAMEGIYTTTRPGAAVPMPPAGLNGTDQTLIGLWRMDNQ